MLELFVTPAHPGSPSSAGHQPPPVSGVVISKAATAAAGSWDTWAISRPMYHYNFQAWAISCK